MASLIKKEFSSINQIDIVQVVGWPTLIVSAIAGVIILILFVVGVRARRGGRDHGCYREWLSSLALWMFVFGVMTAAAFLSRFSFNISISGGVTAPHLYYSAQGEALTRVELTSFVALVSLTASMILRLVPQRKRTSSS